MSIIAQIKSSSQSRKLQGYPRQKTFDLFRAWKPLNGDSEKLSEALQGFFDSIMTPIEQQRILNAYRDKK